MQMLITTNLTLTSIVMKITTKHYIALQAYPLIPSSDLYRMAFQPMRLLITTPYLICLKDIRLF